MREKYRKPRGGGHLCRTAVMEIQFSFPMEENRPRTIFPNAGMNRNKYIH